MQIPEQGQGYLSGGIFMVNLEKILDFGSVSIVDFKEVNTNWNVFIEVINSTVFWKIGVSGIPRVLYLYSTGKITFFGSNYQELFWKSS